MVDLSCSKSDLRLAEVTTLHGRSRSSLFKDCIQTGLCLFPTRHAPHHIPPHSVEGCPMSARYLKASVQSTALLAGQFITLYTVQFTTLFTGRTRFRYIHIYRAGLCTSESVKLVGGSSTIPKDHTGSGVAPLCHLLSHDEYL